MSDFGINLGNGEELGGVDTLPHEDEVTPIAEVVQPAVNPMPTHVVGNIAILATAADFVRCLAAEVAEDGTDLADNINGLDISDDSVCELTLQVLREHFAGSTKLNLEHGRNK